MHEKIIYKAERLAIIRIDFTFQSWIYCMLFYSHSNERQWL